MAACKILVNGESDFCVRSSSQMAIVSPLITILISDRLLDIENVVSYGRAGKRALTDVSYQPLRLVARKISIRGTSSHDLY